MLFFTADHHFGHGNIIHYQERPFHDAAEMDGVMIERWNGVVGPTDIVYHLGDFSLNSQANDYFARLNGRIFVLANLWHHDKRWIQHSVRKEKCASRYALPVELVDPMVVMVATTDNGPQSLVLCHYPLAVWDKKHYGAWHLHGHSHCGYKAPGPNEFIMDVGVDCNNFTPVSLEQVEKYMATRQ